MPYYKRFSGDRMLENFDAIGEGIIGGFAGWLSGQGQAGVETGFATGYSDARKFQKYRKKWLKKSTIGSARSLYGSTPWSRRGNVYGSNPRPPIYGSPPEWDPVRAKSHALGTAVISDLQPFIGTYRG